MDEPRTAESLWIVERQAVYGQGVVTAFISLPEAQAFCAEWAPDSDGHHSWRITEVRPGQIRPTERDDVLGYQNDPTRVADMRAPSWRPGQVKPPTVDIDAWPSPSPATPEGGRDEPHAFVDSAHCGECRATWLVSLCPECDSGYCHGHAPSPASPAETREGRDAEFELTGLAIAKSLDTIGGAAWHYGSGAAAIYLECARRLLRASGEGALDVAEIHRAAIRGLTATGWRTPWRMLPSMLRSTSTPLPRPFPYPENSQEGRADGRRN